MGQSKAGRKGGREEGREGGRKGEREGGEEESWCSGYIGFIPRITNH